MDRATSGTRISCGITKVLRYLLLSYLEHIHEDRSFSEEVLEVYEQVPGEPGQAPGRCVYVCAEGPASISFNPKPTLPSEIIIPESPFPVLCALQHGPISRQRVAIRRVTGPCCRGRRPFQMSAVKHRPLLYSRCLPLRSSLRRQKCKPVCGGVVVLGELSVDECQWA